MNLKYKMWLLISITIIGITFVFIFLSANMDIFIASMTVMVTFYISLRNYFLEYDKFFKELFENFNNRYDGINNALNLILDDSVLSNHQKEIIIDYFNLCAEEYMWKKRGRIPSLIYLSWLNGTIFHLRKTPIKEMLTNELVNNRKSYYGWIEFIIKKV